jgi:hypothetical protein
MFRVEVRAHATGEVIDDTRAVEKPTAQTLSPSTSSGSSKDSIAWTTAAVGVVGSARSDMRDAVAAPFEGYPQSQQPGGPGGTPGDSPAPPKTGAPAS